jgi:hypothetical protein
MENFSLIEVPKEDLKALGLMKDDKVLLNDDTLKQLLKGELTDFVKLDNININGRENMSLDAKLSLYKKDSGETSLLIHPIYNKVNIPKELSNEEANIIQQNGVTQKVISAYGKLTDFGNASYQNNPKNSASFFVELEKFDGTKTVLWGVELEEALKQSSLKKNEMIQISHLGQQEVKVNVPIFDENNVFIKSEEKLVDKNLWKIEPFSQEKKKEKILLFEFDKETKSFVSVDASNVKVPVQVNGKNLNNKNKEDFKNGKKTVLEDGTEIQYSPTAKGSIISNKNLLIVSLLLDGGLSYMLLRGGNMASKQLDKNKQTEYSKGYLEALKKVQNDLEIKSHNFPNDKTIKDDLNALKGEIGRITTVSNPTISKEKSVNDVLEKINDPEIENTPKAEKDEIKNKEKHDLKEGNTFIEYGGNIFTIEKIDLKNNAVSIKSEDDQVVSNIPYSVLQKNYSNNEYTVKRTEFNETSYQNEIQNSPQKNNSQKEEEKPSFKMGR